MRSAIVNIVNIFIAIGGLYLSSCTENDIDLKDITDSVDMNVVFDYKGQSYNYQIVGGVAAFADTATEKIVSELNQNPNLATLIRNNGVIEYFDSYEDCAKVLEAGTIESRGVERVVGEHKSKIKICQNANLTGISVTLNNTSSYPLTNSNFELSDYNLAGRVSSFKLEHLSTVSPLAPISYVTFYEGANRTGRTLSYQTSGVNEMTLTVGNLKAVVYDASGATWNDRIKSLYLR